MSEDTLYHLVVGTAFCTALLVAILAPQRRLMPALALLSLAGFLTGLFFWNVPIFHCGGEICLTGLVVCIFVGAATLLGDVILLGRWLWPRFGKATDSSRT